ncbi:MAG: cyanophycinase [Anaerolineae bacterium]|nr:cyanophycinase [Anaerolineae bacterium]
MPSSFGVPDTPRGPLVVIGGAEDKLGDRLILRRFVDLAGGGAARIAVLPVASSFSVEVAGRYEHLFRDLGASHVETVDVAVREEALHADRARPLDEATGIFLTGGNQLKIATLLGGTPIATTLRRRHAAGVVVGGTSAGASALSQHMIAFGRGGPSPTQRMVSLSPGLGLTNRVVIDQHFRQRDRIGRLMAAVAFNPFLIGVGVDEDTAMILDHRNLVEVVGRHSVTFVDGADITYTDIHQVKQHANVAVYNLRVHVLTHGQRFDLVARQPLLPMHVLTQSAPVALEAADDE